MKRSLFRALVFIVAIGFGFTADFAQPTKANSAMQRTPKQVAADDALLEASEDGDVSATQAALKAGANVNAYGSNGKTPLIYASRAGKYDLVRILLNAGASPVMQDDSGFTAADVAGMFANNSAAAGGDYGALSASINRKAELNEQAKPAKTLAENLIDALIAKDTVKAAALINQGAYIDFIDKRFEGQPTPLILAVTNGEADTVDLLIKKGVRMDRADKMQRTALIYAANAGFTSIAERLIKAGAGIDKFDSEENTPLTAAINGGFVDCVQMLVNNKVNVNGYLTGGKATPLGTAIYTRHPAFVPILLKAKADPNKVDSKGATPLMYAAVLNDIESARLLLKAGADPNLKNKQGHTALDFAKAKSPEITILLEPLTAK